MRSRLFVLVAGAVMVDTVFFSAIAPVLPHYVDELDLSKASAGVLTAAYPAGTLLASIPAGLIADRVGARRTLAGGLVILAATSFVFAFGHHIAVLDCARFVQGFGGAAAWTGGLAWLTQTTPAAERGEVLGSALAAAVVGVMLGPVVGGVAVVLGPEAVFSGIGLVALGLLVFCATTPPSPAPQPGTLGTVFTALRDRGVLAGFWLVLLPALYAGVLGVLVPLRMDELGASGTAIGAAFLVAAAIEATLGPVVGRISDRRGRLVPIRVGLMGAIPLAVVLPVPPSALAVGALLVVTVAFLAGFWAPAMALLSESGERAGVAQGFAFALMNLAWGTGEMAGSGGGGGLAQATSDQLPYALLAVLCAVTLAGALRQRTAAAAYASSE